MSKPDNPPAFPFSPDGPNYRTHAGLTMRDWFAGQALAGELAAQSQPIGEWTVPHFPALATRIYLIADAMLAERAKEISK